MAREAKEAEEKSGSKKPGKSHGFAAQHPFFLFLTDIISALFCSHHRCLLKIVRDDISKLPGCVQLLVRRGWLPKCGTESKLVDFFIFLEIASKKLLKKISLFRKIGFPDIV